MKFVMDAVRGIRFFLPSSSIIFNMILCDLFLKTWWTLKLFPIFFLINNNATINSLIFPTLQAWIRRWVSEDYRTAITTLPSLYQHALAPLLHERILGSTAWITLDVISLCTNLMNEKHFTVPTNLYFPETEHFSSLLAFL